MEKFFKSLIIQGNILYLIVERKIVLTFICAIISMFTLLVMQYVGEIFFSDLFQTDMLLFYPLIPLFFLCAFFLSFTNIAICFFIYNKIDSNHYHSKHFITLVFNIFFIQPHIFIFNIGKKDNNSLFLFSVNSPTMIDRWNSIFFVVYLVFTSLIFLGTAIFKTHESLNIMVSVLPIISCAFGLFHIFINRKCLIESISITYKNKLICDIVLFHGMVGATLFSLIIFSSIIFLLPPNIANVIWCIIITFSFCLYSFSLSVQLMVFIMYIIIPLCHLNVHQRK